MIEADMPTIACKDSLRAIAQGKWRVFLKDYVNATIGFAELGRRMGKDDKNLMRLLSPHGDPTASTLMVIVQTLSKAEDITIAARITPRQPSPAL